MPDEYGLGDSEIMRADERLNVERTKFIRACIEGDMNQMDRALEIYKNQIKKADIPIKQLLLQYKK